MEPTLPGGSGQNDQTNQTEAFQPEQEKIIFENTLETPETLQQSIPPNNPLDNIALALSGGGFRAASFSLGVLSYLNRIEYKKKPLLHAVKFITSTSGGTITNAYYSATVYKGIPFTTFYNNLREKMSREVLLQQVAAILKNANKWTEKGIVNDENGEPKEIRKQRNLINAFAKAYDELLFNNATLADITEAYIDKSNALPHLEETAFNTTEFNNGLAFYFQANGHEHRVFQFGNGYLRFNDTSIVKNLKLADLVASSSCFPGGFEPILYPYDFVHAGNTDINALLKGITYSQNDPTQINEVKNKPFALMDGGIVDNIGINCILKADDHRRKKSGKGFDLILSCDVTSYFNDPLQNNGKPVVGFYKNFTLQGIINIFKYANIFLLVSIAAILLPLYPIAGYFLLLPSLLLSILYWVGVLKLRKAKKDETGIVAIALKYLDYFLTLPLKHLIPMIRSRVKSVSTLVGALFLKQIRRDQYNYLFQVPAMKDRAIACLVYEFGTSFQSKRKENLEKRDKDWWSAMKDVLMPTPAIQKMVDNARTMGTTLWFTAEDQDKRDDLIATGQLTVCYSLIKHICRLEILDKKYITDKDLQDLKVRLIADWKRFCNNPKCMI
jgi:predicted acylesterase/phospholipase RssA